MDIDKIFNLPKLSSSSVNKRKWKEPTADALKAFKSDSVHDASTSSRHSLDEDRAPSPPGSRSRSKRPTVEDEDDEFDEDGERRDDAADFAPGNDADYFVEEDDEGGRFFGGGLTDQQKKILEIMSRGDGADHGDEQLTLKPEAELAKIRKQLLKFERAINKNQEMRVKYSDDPRKFIESEADLDFELKGLVVLTTNPGLFYPELVKVGSVNSLIGLLSHENADIASATIELIEELTDDDVLDAGENLEDEEEEREDGQVERNGQEGMRLFVDSLAENQILELLVSNLQRFKDEPVSEANGAAAEGRAQEEEETDAQAIFHTLGALENLVSFKPSLAESLVQETEFLKWTLERVKRKGGYDQNKGYAGEMLAIVLSSSEKNRRRVGQVGGIDVLLGVLAQYRKRDPIDADETEFMENIFDALCSCLSLDENKALFFEGEGVELMVIIMKEKRMSRLRSIKVLNHALSGPGGSKNCVKFIESLGLKTLFSAFMGKGSTANGSKAKKRKKAEAASTTTLEDEEHILGIIVSLLNNLESESAERIRLLSKFVEEEYEKVDRLLEVRENLVSRIQSVETGIEKEKKELEEEGIEIGDEEQEVFYLRRLENGLFSLQLVDYITAWICMEDDGVRAHVKMLLERKGSGLEDVIQVLKEYHDNMGDESVAIGSEREERGEKQTEVKTKDIIVALVNFLLAS